MHSGVIEVQLLAAGAGAGASFSHALLSSL